MSDETWLSDHILGEGDAETRAAAEQRIAADPELRRRAEQLRALTERLDALPDAAWSVLDGDERPLPEPTADHPHAAPARHRRLRRAVLALAAVALVFAAGLGAGAAIWSTWRSGPARGTIVLRPLAAGVGARGVVRLTRAGELELAVSGLPRTSAGHFYEAWLMTSQTHLIALASFRVSAGGRARIEVSPPAPVDSYRFIDISLQAAAAGTAHSRDSVLRGPTSSS